MSDAITKCVRDRLKMKYRTEHDMKMMSKGYRYTLRPVNSDMEPLYAKKLVDMCALVVDWQRSDNIEFECFDMSNVINTKRGIQMCRCGGTLVCSSMEAVDVQIKRLRKMGYNHFTRFIDSRGPAVQYTFDELETTTGCYMSSWN